MTSNNRIEENSSEKGAERPGLLHDDGTIRDLSQVIDDISGAQLSHEALSDLRGCDASALPVVAPGIVAATRMPADKPGYARALYGTLHALDALGVDTIWLETPPQDEAWRDVHDRLSRAATPG